MPGRQYTGATGYRYGFNGKEKDDEVKGSGASYDYGFRIYDPRLGKFLSIDPLTKDYPWYTPYQFAGNTPIQAIDLDGLEEFIVTDYYNSSGELYKTKISIINNFQTGSQYNKDQLVHRSKVEIDKNGNATVKYVGTEIGFKKENEKKHLKQYLNPDKISIKKDGSKEYVGPNLLKKGKISRVLEDKDGKILKSETILISDINYTTKDGNPDPENTVFLPSQTNAVPSIELRHDESGNTNIPSKGSNQNECTGGENDKTLTNQETIEGENSKNGNGNKTVIIKGSKQDEKQ